MELLTTKDLGEFEALVEQAQEEASHVINKIGDVETKLAEIEQNVQQRLKEAQAHELNAISTEQALRAKVVLLEAVILEVIDMLPIEARGGAISKLLYTPRT